MAKTATNQENIESTSLLSAADCARMCRISRRSWFRLAASARAPACVRIGASPRWRRKDLELWIALGCPDQKALETMQQAAK